jgi:catechol 2,3-dioxygenase-like lactoylglutathione lyase family enzyme
MELKGVNHLALVCRDMEETIRFYTQVLGMKLVKTVALPDGGQHFFLDCGGGAMVAFFWWADVPPAAPGVASVKHFPRDTKTAVGSMNHIAFSVPEELMEGYLERLSKEGVLSIPAIVNHDDSEYGVSAEQHPGVFVRSIYFTDPNGIMLELAAFTREFTDEDVRHKAASAPSPATAPSPVAVA